MSNNSSLDFYDLDSLLTDEERMVQKSVRQFVNARVLPIIEKNYRAGTFPEDLIGGFADLGTAAAGLAEAGLLHGGDQLGGTGFGVRDHGGIRREPPHLGCVDVDTNGFQTIGAIGPARHCRQFHPRSDSDHQIGVRP